MTLSRVEADSALVEPPWIQVCSPCPVAEARVEVEDGAGTLLDVEAMWSPLRECVLGLASDPLPARPSVPATVALLDPVGRVASWDFDLALPEGRGSDPVDLNGATWHLPLPEEAFRLLGGADVLPGLDGGLLLSLGSADIEGKRPLTVAGSRGTSPVQDTCAATGQWSAPATLLSRQVGARLFPGDLLPGGLVAERGALQARLSEEGDALLDVSLLALVSLSLSEEALGGAPDVICATATAELGFDPCVPCGPPSDGVSGLPACIPILMEGARAERLEAPLVSVDPDSISPDCRQSVSDETQ
ncbi:MAG: hypothetical protein KDA24_23285 [Deltaproteobacteria bacterium]|nr:hypothetical protein [Deltaproteobacteria bacterium]